MCSDIADNTTSQKYFFLLNTNIEYNTNLKYNTNIEVIKFLMATDNPLHVKRIIFSLSHIPFQGTIHFLGSRKKTRNISLLIYKNSSHFYHPWYADNGDGPSVEGKKQNKTKQSKNPKIQKIHARLLAALKDRNNFDPVEIQQGASKM